MLKITSHSGTFKTTVRYHYTTTRMAKVKRLTISSANKNVEELALP